MHYIYVITNTVNGMQYVGQSINVKHRWASHKCTSHSEDSRLYTHPLYQDMREYGIDVFEIDVIETVYSQDDADTREEFWIAELNALVPNGYNKAKGRRHTGIESYWKTHPVTQEMREKASKVSKGRFAGEKNYFYGKHFYGEQNSFYGKKHTEETRRKMSENHWDNSGANNSMARKCICVETGQIFDTIKEASKSIGVTESCVRGCCVGKQKTSGGYHWMYYEDYLEQNKEK